MPSSHGTDVDGSDAPPLEHGSEAPGAACALDAARTSAELESELARSEDRYKRALADLENFRKRSAREADRKALEAKQSVLRDWLEALDSVERALQMQPSGPCAEGLRAVLAQMDAVLDRQRVERLGARGERFDPERHEAVGIRASAGDPDNTVLEVQRSGFSHGDRVIRPAQVVVARTPERAR
jgi:molecular chaperone GrpE